MEEIFDIVNEEDKIIDRQPRALAHELGLWHRGAHVFLFNTEQKLLVQKRSAERAQSPSLLDCSVSEHVQSGESYLAAARRGVKEEMGLEGITLTKVVKFRMNYGPGDNEISTLYEGRIGSAQPRFDPVEVESIQFLSADELKSMLEHKSETLCPWFIELLRFYFYKKGKMEILDS